MFPPELDHWTLQEQWSTQPRAFTDQWITAAGPDYGEFPATMNGCYAPGFQLAGPTDHGSTLVDVGVEVQQHWPAP